eukprot:TRINITY_DN7465_c0_g6_i1.p1 TRINITY_DN7465_c0_g6~~TRINITY_DN7465_c0_g6_i1.p1  ORF type:complete len:609 (-),score=118.27 TRINITY_DN7465_c0_g6_i1:52-1878(-)
MENDDDSINRSTELETNQEGADENATKAERDSAASTLSLSSSSSSSSLDTVTTIEVVETPLPLDKLIVILCILFSESFAATMLFSFVNFMVRDFGIEDDDVGYYVGWLASSFFLGQFVSSFFWGYFSDKNGRRPTLLIGLSGTLISMLWFGLSSTFTSAICARAFGGLLNSNFAIGKAVMSDLTDSTNKARGFAYIGMMWGMGTVLGPLLGGLLSAPVQHFPGLFGGTVFETHPYLLPTSVASSVCFIGLIGTLLYLPETVGSHSNGPNNEVELQIIKQDDYISSTTDDDDQTSVNALSAISRPELLESKKGFFSAIMDKIKRKPDFEKLSADSASVNTDMSDLEKLSTPSSEINDDESPNIDDIDENADEDDNTTKGNSHASGGRISEPSKLEVTLSLLKDKTVQKACGLYAMLSIVFITLDELLPLWAATEIAKGGLAFKEVDIGILWLVSGISLLIFQMFIYARLANKFGPLNTFKSGAVISAFAIGLMPMTSMLVVPLGRYGVWVGIAVIMIFRTWGGTMCFTSANILVNGSAAPEHSGKVNGLAMSVSGLTRSIGPAFGGIVYAWSLSVGHFPIDYRFLFLVLSSLNIVDFVIASLLPKNLGQ